MPRGSINRADMGQLYVKGVGTDFQAARLNNDVSKPFAGEGLDSGSASDQRVTLGSGHANGGTAGETFSNAGAERGGGAAGHPTFDFDFGGGFVFTGGGSTSATVERSAGFDQSMVESAVPGRVCGTIGDITGNPALDGLLQQFEGMTRGEARAEMQGWDRAELREFRSDFYDHFGVNIMHADWLWG